MYLLVCDVPFARSISVGPTEKAPYPFCHEKSLTSEKTSCTNRKRCAAEWATSDNIARLRRGPKGI